MKHKHGKSKLLAVLLAFVMVFSLFSTALATSVDSSYTPGSYTGSATGYGGTVTVTVTLAKQNDAVVISDITATGQKESPEQWNKAITVLDEIKKQNGTTGVDTVSGATRSSSAILAATENALEKAGSSLGGSGTERDPYRIGSAAQLAAFAAAVDGGDSYEGKYVVLTGDIDLSSIANWNPIGAEGSSGTFFRGTFDGRGYTISGLTIAANVTSGESNHGLFSTLGNQAVVKNLHVTGAQISATSSANENLDKVRAGVIAGSTEKVATSSHGNIGTRIDSCSATGTVSATSTSDKMSYAGGITGMADIGTAITNCWTDVTVTATVTPKGTKNSMAGGIIGSSGNYVVIANCAAFGTVYAASPSSTNFGGMAGGIVGMMAGKQYNAYATGDVTVGNGGTAHTWVGVLDGEVTSSGMTKDSSGAYTVYPAQGAFRLGNYYASDAVLKMEVYKNNGAELDTTKTITPTVDRGFSSTLTSLDKAMVSVAMTKQAMADTAFAETLNGNIQEINGVLAAYGITGIALREWQVEDGKVLPTGSVWVSGEIDAGIFDSGDGTEENPYLIKTEAQLRAFAVSMNDKIDYTGKYVALGADLRLSEDSWTPIGGSQYLFNGTFDGCGHSISGMRLGTAEQPYALDRENLYIGLFGVLGPKALVKQVNLNDVAFYTSYEATAYLGGIAGVTQGVASNGNYTGAVIDSCHVSGVLSLTSTKGNQFVGGLVGMQYKGAIINSSAQGSMSGVVTAGDLAEVGGLVGLNNRGLVANCWADAAVYGSGSRENGDEGMAVVSNLIACNAGAQVNCYGSGDVTTKEHSTYAGMVSGWVTGIGKSYTCWYDLDSTMIVGKDTDNPLTVKPVESIGTKVASGVNDEGDAYTGGLVDKMTGYSAAGYAALAESLNGTFAAFPIDITLFGLENTALKNWVYDAASKKVTFGDTMGSVTYVQPACEKVEKPEQKMQDGTWYGRDADKTTVVKITVVDGAITKTEVLSGADSGTAYEAALDKAEYKAIYGDFSHYEAADPSRFAGGSGTEQDPYRIANAEQLRYLSSSINADVDWSGKYFKQTANITLTGEWQPIGWALNGEVNGKKTAICAYPFRGNYDGGDFTISGLRIGSEAAPADQMASGLFGLTAGAYSTNDQPSGDEQVVRLSNIHLEDIAISVATRYETFTGGLVGSGQTGIYIDNCSVTGKISVETTESFARAGGLAASVLRGAVTNSWADVEITAETDTSNVYAGGFYGMDNRVTTVNCYSLGSVTGNSTNNNKVHIGGFAGQAGGIHVNCYAAGDVVSLKTTTDVGILSGRSAGINIDYHCYYNTEATLRQGDTTVTPAVAVGVVTTHATEVDVTGKTKAELADSAFAALLNSNSASSAMASTLAEINQLLANPGSELAQANYYTGTALSAWTAKNGVVTFGKTSTGGGGSSGGSGSSTYTVTVQTAEHGSVTASHKSAASGTVVTLQPAPDAGYALEKLTVTDSKGQEIKLDQANGKYTFTMPNSAVKVTAVFQAAQTSENPFVDVTKSAYYYDAVLWAKEKGVTGGTDATHFSPEEACTRAQIVTFLWRAAGSPEAKSAESFSDVAADAYYAKAVAWAVEKGITTGTGEGKFSPEDTCTRAQGVTFLFRALGAQDKEAASTGFQDVPAGSYYEKAVAWAVEKGITEGVGDQRFAPDENCTRAQIVTFLYRAMANAK